MTEKKTEPIVWALNFPLSASRRKRLYNELSRHGANFETRECSCGASVPDGDFDWHFAEVAYLFGRISR